MCGPQLGSIRTSKLEDEDLFTVKHPPQMKYFSQFGQDYWVMDQMFPNLRGGYFVDVGAYHMSNGYMSYTLALERQRDWTGLLIEPNTALCGPLRSRKASLINSVVSSGGETLQFQFGDRGCTSKIVASGGVSVPTETLTCILDRMKAPLQIELLSIDVEGHEFDVIKGIDLQRYRFGCIIIEANSQKAKIVSHLGKNRYHFIEQFGVDLYFSAVEAFPKRPSELASDWEHKPDRAKPIHPAISPE
ncbi:MAG: FkbM family methyltransferase [Verrucomicrobiae bacterium]|nr:FkbM family methyltransferase [Verrucomicrobiae bacterium]